MNDPAEDKKIADADILKRFLDEGPVKEAFAKLDAKYVAAMRGGATTAERESAWAKAAALAEIQTELRVIMDTGTVAAVYKARREGKSPK